jgi:flagellar motility protein MotE (MotC chaperone)
MIAAGGALSFGGAFVLGWLTQTATPAEGPGKPMSSDSMAIGSTPTAPEAIMLSPPGAAMSGMGETGNEKARKAMTEKQLKSLVYEVRENRREYNNKLEGLRQLEQRLKMAHDDLKGEIENLNNLRIKLASTVARLQSERDKLLKSRVEIDEIEKANLMSIATAYDKMDVSSASKILTKMCAMGESRAVTKDPGSGGSGMDDAVKILHYMSERRKAKLLAEVVNSEPKLAAVLCQRLKQIVERE